MKTITLVEDDTSIQDVFALALDPELHKVVVYESGNDILQGNAPVPDLFVLDKSISGTSGLDVCRFIKSSKKYDHVPVIIMSAAPDLLKVARDVGANGIIAKPFSLKNLRETIFRHTS